MTPRFRLLLEMDGSFFHVRFVSEKPGVQGILCQLLFRLENDLSPAK